MKKSIQKIEDIFDIKNSNYDMTFNTLQDQKENYVNPLEGAASVLTKYFSNTSEKASIGVNNAFSSGKSYVSENVSVPGFGDIYSKAKNQKENLTESVKNLGTNTADLIEGFIGSLKNSGKKTFDSIREYGVELTDTVQSYIPSRENLIKGGVALTAASIFAIINPDYTAKAQVTDSPHAWKYAQLLKEKGKKGQNFTLSSTAGYDSKKQTVDDKSIKDFITKDGERYKVERGIGVKDGLNFHIGKEGNIEGLITALSQEDMADGKRFVVGFFDKQNDSKYHSQSLDLTQYNPNDIKTDIAMSFGEGFENFDPSDKWQMMLKDNKDSQGNNDTILASVTKDLNGLNVKYIRDKPSKDSTTGKGKGVRSNGGGKGSQDDGDKGNRLNCFNFMTGLEDMISNQSDGSLLHVFNLGNGFSNNYESIQVPDFPKRDIFGFTGGAKFTKDQLNQYFKALSEIAIDTEIPFDNNSFEKLGYSISGKKGYNLFDNIERDFSGTNLDPMGALLLGLKGDGYEILYDSQGIPTKIITVNKEIVRDLYDKALEENKEISKKDNVQRFTVYPGGHEYMDESETY